MNNKIEMNFAKSHIIVLALSMLLPILIVLNFNCNQGCGSGYFSTTSTPIASASTNKKQGKRPLTIFLKLLWVSTLPSPTLYHFAGTKTFIYCYYFTYFA